MDARFFAEHTLTERVPQPMALAPAEVDAAREPEPAPPDDRAFDAQDWVTRRVMDAYN